MPFKRTLSGQGEGRYVISGRIRRVDHPAAVAASRKRGAELVVGREDARGFFVKKGTKSGGFENVYPPGTFTSGPAICSRRGRVDVFGRGDDRRIYQAWKIGSGSWVGWEPMGIGTFRSGPAAVARAGGRIDLFAVGDNDHIWRRQYSGIWSNWGPGLDAASAGLSCPLLRPLRVGAVVG